MSWTDERLEKLKSLWNSGLTASQIADELGGVSRNAVIGKAHRLGLESRPTITPAMLEKVADLPVGKRTKRLMANDNVIYVGDLVQKTEAELLRTPDLGKQTLLEVRSALAAVGLRLGMWVPGWPPSHDVFETSARRDNARRVSELRQTRGGATFHPAHDHFVMSIGGDESDFAAAQKPMTRQMQSALLQKARSFADVAVRLDNRTGWTGIGRAASTLAELLNRPTDDIPDVLGLLYPIAIELGSFVEFDQQLGLNVDSYATPLDPEVRRPLSDLVRSLAPWLRAFPSIREADDEAGRFLIEAAAIKSTFDVVEAAARDALLTASDVEVFRELHGAIKRGAFQGKKAGGRAKRSASNFVISAAVFAGSVAGSLFVGAVASDVATTSPLMHKVGQFLVRNEEAIESLLADMPQDLRYSISEFVDDISRHPLLPSQSPEVVTPLRVPFRAGDRLGSNRR